ncbi:hypothetical protein EF294_20665 [Gordonia oryzae]|uniref:Integrase catalytic domain-containing protein n=1 Tax=Gordonia oryzae TaxID=2487349 RepID=A0A3N4G3Q2_9ACTN|nr:hypothetical protein EF294_20665 [Gordonia oryzae]
MDDLQEGHRTTRRPQRHQIAFPPARIERQPVQRSLVKTLKYALVFPARFGSIQHAREFMSMFADWYNHDHHHSGIGLHAPGDVHYGHAPTVASPTLSSARRGPPHPPRKVQQPDRPEDPRPP